MLLTSSDHPILPAWTGQAPGKDYHFFSCCSVVRAGLAALKISALDGCPIRGVVMAGLPGKMRRGMRRWSLLKWAQNVSGCKTTEDGRANAGDAQLITAAGGVMHRCSAAGMRQPYPRNHGAVMQPRFFAWQGTCSQQRRKTGRAAVAHQSRTYCWQVRRYATHKREDYAG